jgi:hypothetical protein
MSNLHYFCLKVQLRMPGLPRARNPIAIALYSIPTVNNPTYLFQQSTPVADHSPARLPSQLETYNSDTPAAAGTPPVAARHFVTAGVDNPPAEDRASDSEQGWKAAVCPPVSVTPTKRNTDQTVVAAATERQHRILQAFVPELLDHMVKMAAVRMQDQEGRWVNTGLEDVLDGSVAEGSGHNDYLQQGYHKRCWPVQMDQSPVGHLVGQQVEDHRQ